MSPSLAPHRQFHDLFLIQLANFRWSWRSMLITGICAPVLMTISFAVVAQGTNVPHLLSGGVVLSLMFQNQNNVAGNFAHMKFAGMLDFFATLPIHRSLVVLATVLAFYVLSLPSLAVTLVLGAVVLGVDLTVSPLALLVIPLCVLPMAGIGALIGISARAPELAGATSLLVTLVLVFLGPVVLPPDRLPDWVLAISHASPTTYAASAIRQVLLGPVTPRLWLDAAVLAGVTVLTLWWVGHRLPWRQK